MLLLTAARTSKNRWKNARTTTTCQAVSLRRRSREGGYVIGSNRIGSGRIDALQRPLSSCAPISGFGHLLIFPREGQHPILTETKPNQNPTTEPPFCLTQNQHAAKTLDPAAATVLFLFSFIYLPLSVFSCLGGDSVPRVIFCHGVPRSCALMAHARRLVHACKLLRSTHI